MGSSVAKPKVESSTGKLSALSKRIEENTRVLTDQLRSKGAEAPSFHPNGLADFPMSDLDEASQRARHEIISLTQELHDLVLGPRESLKDLAWSVTTHVSLQAIVEFRIPEAVPVEGSISYQDLSLEVERLTGTKTSPFDLRRLLRLAVCSNIFAEQQPGYISHNRTSLLFLEDESIMGWVGLYTTDLLLPVANTVPAMRKWPCSQESNETGVNITFNHSLPYFDHIQAESERTKRYNLVMRANMAREGYDMSHTIESYPWGSLGKATVVDMGGNEGFVSFALAEAFPNLSFIVQDQAGMRTPAAAGNVPGHLAERVTLATHDFFDPQPVVAEAYLFRHVLHAFSDRYAVEVLRALAPALRRGAHVIVNDYALPQPGAVSRLEERYVRTMDVMLQTVCNSRERDVEDWRRLFAEADPRFRLRGAWKSSGRLWFVDVTWEP